MSTFTIPAALRAPGYIQVSGPASRRERPVRRERDFGTGYGNSSGYAAGKRYVRDWGSTRFRVG